MHKTNTIQCRWLISRSSLYGNYFKPQRTQRLIREVRKDGVCNCDISFNYI